MNDWNGPTKCCEMFTSKTRAKRYENDFIFSPQKKRKERKSPVCICTTVSVHCSARNDHANKYRAIPRNDATPITSAVKESCFPTESGSTIAAANFQPHRPKLCIPQSNNIVRSTTKARVSSNNNFVNYKLHVCHEEGAFVLGSFQSLIKCKK